MPFGAFKDVGERRSLDHERAQRRQQEAMGQWQYVNVVFTTPDVDLPIQHALTSVDPEQVRYAVIRQSANAVIYEDLSASRVAWIKGVIRLRASVPTAARLLLFIEAPSTTPAAVANSDDGYVAPGTGSLDSVGLTMPPEFTVSGSPATGAGGTIAVGKANETANTIYSGPASGSPAGPTFRAMVNADLYPTPQFTSVCEGGTLDANAVHTSHGTYNSHTFDNGNSGTAKTIDWSQGNDQFLTLTGNVTITFSNPTDNARYSLLVATGAGSFTMTWPATVSWPGGTTPTTTATASVYDIYVFHYNASLTKYIAHYAQNYS